MYLLTAIRRNERMRRLGKTLERSAKAWCFRLLSRRGGNARAAGPETLKGVQRVLLVRPNFRIGNAVIGARFIQALTESRADIEIDYLGADTTRALFEGMPLARYHALSRSMPLRPWRLLQLLMRLRRRDYDLAIQVGEGSLTSWLCMRLCGARRTLGQRGRLEASYDWVGDVSRGHAYEWGSALAASLGLAWEPRPWMVISARERAAAASLAGAGDSTSPVGIFVGGHLDKRFPFSFWQALLGELERRRQPYLVLLGPEEEAGRARLEQACGFHGRVVPAVSLRCCAALLANLSRLITPDTGPMHMAVALGVPVVALLNVDGSRKFTPRGPEDRVLFRPAPARVAELVSPGARRERSHDAVKALPCRPSAPMDAEVGLT
ncbi:glycosyltransferase family 9 protein [Halomonas elongata]|uniref:Glycosyltransferase family 9 protein n=2 Tax=Halomonas elongata TaxID=2746 RepID=E1V7A6_HALED|nr:glycosyltransferase family 9 protein [Halomonas elongata]MDL4861695.1 glycosyltransferase family 9 protein [Halomonas elongata]OBX37749.1 glycosyltransferase family 9 (heptosyltransferase) [Halomonas elongata]WBF18692.1 glycosyltransferase family 9 protein [Halomonas elongata]WPU47547.1 glycosyltransferase family 9 protein [Halomonas elongata DSM 2581]CBV41456.1 probable glycosyltransferase, type 9 [Halomonas elongata DSM 2581]